MAKFRSVTIVLLTVFLLIGTPFTILAQTGDDQITLPPWRRELPAGRNTAKIVVGETPLTVDLAISGAEQSLGLGYRNGLEPGTGMLFAGSDARPRTFWMKGMRFCLDIVWIEDDQIVGAAEWVCPDPIGTPDAERARFSSPEPVTHVLEVPAGWLADQEYGPGTPVEVGDIPGL